MKNNTWSLDQIPNLTGKVAIVTGSNVGLGYKSAVEFARNGAHVILSCRSEEKAVIAKQRLKQEIPSAQLDSIVLDLVNSDSIQAFADQFYAKHNTLDILINNAGVVNLASLQRAPSGHEMHMATNHLGHFALTGLLSEALLATPDARVVTLSSGGYKVGVIDFDDFKWEKRPYHRIKSYGDSKLANVLFTLELQRYFDQYHPNKALSVAAHPGLTGTERQQSIGVGGWLSRVMASPVEKGVLPQLRAATDLQVQAGDFYGPRFGIWGCPTQEQFNKKALDESLAKQLWEYSEQETGVKFA